MTASLTMGPLAGVRAAATAAAPGSGGWLSPSALAVSGDERLIYVACATASKILAVDRAGARVQRAYDLPAPPSGLVLSRDGTRLFVVCAAPASPICELDLATGSVATLFTTGHTAMSPVLSPDGQTLYLALRFEGQVVSCDLGRRQERGRLRVGREPIALGLTPDGLTLLVAHHLPEGPADAPDIAARVSVVDTAALAVTHEWRLLPGSGLLRDIRVAPDGRHAVVVHTLAHFHLPTTQLERGWMNTSALTLFDLAARRPVNTVLLDELDRGAANPWGVGWSADGRHLLVTHAGTHELSVIDFPKLLAKLASLPAAPAGTTPSYGSGPPSAAEVPQDLTFLLDLRQRIRLQGLGPRAVVALRDGGALVAHYFSDSLEVVRWEPPPAKLQTLTLGPAQPMDTLRRGEFLFNDASICFQGWQSCASCHSEDGRIDALSWDLLNDGLGNPKNSRSMLFTHRTPPAMSLGVRETAATAVRAGLRHILFTQPTEALAAPMDAWLQSLKPVRSPHLAEGRLSAAAQRGQKLFVDHEVGCATCHPPGLWTNLQAYDVGTAGPRDPAEAHFDTPTLVEVWRTAPYLHDGSSASVREVLTTRNPRDQHGRTAHLTPAQLDDLLEFVLSL